MECSICVHIDQSYSTHDDHQTTFPFPIQRERRQQIPPLVPGPCGFVFQRTAKGVTTSTSTGCKQHEFVCQHQSRHTAASTKTTSASLSPREQRPSNRPRHARCGSAKNQYANQPDYLGLQSANQRSWGRRWGQARRRGLFGRLIVSQCNAGDPKHIFCEMYNRNWKRR